MKRRRAVSSSASWRCIASSVRASWPSSSRAPDSKRAPKSPWATRRAGVLHAPDAAAERARQQVAGQQRAEQREPAGDQHALADERDGGVDVLQRRRVDGDVVDAGLLGPAWRSATAAAPPRPRGRRCPPRCRARPAACAPPPAPRRTAGRRSRAARSSPRRRRSAAPCVPRVRPSRVTRAPEASAAWRTRASSTLRSSEWLSASTIGPEYWRATVLSVSSFFVAHAGLEAGGDPEVDAGDHHQRDGEEQQREAVGERSQLLASPYRGSGSPRRAR